jgi:hypothetical protein
MESSIIIFKADFEKFQSRTFGFYTRVAFFISVFFMNLFLLVFHQPWYIWLTINFIFVLTLVELILKYRYYIDELVIDPIHKTVDYSIFKFDSFFRRDQIAISDIEIKIVDHWFRPKTTYDLKIIHKQKCIVRQQETKYWTKEKFEEIKKLIQRIK